MPTMTLSSSSPLSCQSAAVHSPVSASSSRVVVPAMWHDDSLQSLLYRAHERSMDQIWASSSVVTQVPQIRKAETLLKQQARRQYLSQVIKEALRITL